MKLCFFEIFKLQITTQVANIIGAILARDCLQYWRDIVNNIASILGCQHFPNICQYCSGNIGAIL